MKKFKHFYKIEGDTVIFDVTRRNGKTLKVMIDTEDLLLVLQYRWCGARDGKYISRGVGHPQKKLYLHHFLVGKPGVGEETDHRDRNTFNNRKGNLSHVSISANRTNRKVGNKYGFPGLEYVPGKKALRPWRARLRVTRPNAHTRLLSLGSFSTKKEAIEARRAAELKYHGVFFH